MPDRLKVESLSIFTLIENNSQHTQPILGLFIFQAVAGGYHQSCSCKKRCACIATDRRWKISLLSGACIGDARNYYCDITTDRFNERSGFTIEAIKHFC